MALKIQDIAQELSSLNNTQPFCENNMFVFVLDNLTSLILEKQEEKIFVFLCHKNDSDNRKKAIVIKLLKLLHPGKVQYFFCNIFLLENFIVISICGNPRELLPKNIYQFQNIALKCLMKAKGE